MLNRIIWYMAKPGEERAFTSPIPPSPGWAAALRRNGYFIFKVNIQLPPLFDPSSGELGGELESEATEVWDLEKERGHGNTTDDEAERPVEPRAPEGQE